MTNDNSSAFKNLLRNTVLMCVCVFVCFLNIRMHQYKKEKRKEEEEEDKYCSGKQKL